MESCLVTQKPILLVGFQNVKVVWALCQMRRAIFLFDNLMDKWIWWKACLGIRNLIWSLTRAWAITNGRPRIRCEADCASYITGKPRTPVYRALVYIADKFGVPSYSSRLTLRAPVIPVFYWYALVNLVNTVISTTPSVQKLRQGVSGTLFLTKVFECGILFLVRFEVMVFIFLYAGIPK